MTTTAQQGATRTLGKYRDPWTVWLLSCFTFGIYYLVWYYKINEELRRFAPPLVTVSSGLAVGAQFLPIANLISLANTAGRINLCLEAVGSQKRASKFMAWFSTFWFSSQTRYLQRRLNAIWEAAGAVAR
jgi:hypothetical protein